MRSGNLGPCPWCKKQHTGLVRIELPDYYVECVSCGFVTERKLTKIGAYREWTGFHNQWASCGGWNKDVKFADCCGASPEILVEGRVDPRRNFSGQTVIVRCSTCGKTAKGNCLKRVPWAHR